MLKIRLQRVGKRGQAYFRVVVVEHTKKPKGEFLELLGSYDPHKKVFNVKKDRVEYWMGTGAQISPTVNNLMVNYKVWDKPKMESWKPKVKPKSKQESAVKAEQSAVSAETDEMPQAAEENVEKTPEETKPDEEEKKDEMAAETKEESVPASDNGNN